MKRQSRRPGSRPTNSGSQTRVIKLANLIDVCCYDPSSGGQIRGSAGKGAIMNRPFHGIRLALRSPVPFWADGATRCLNAYIKRDYAACFAAGREVLSHQFIPTVGLVTILALRRQDRSDDADDLGRALLRRGFGRNGMFFLLLMMLLDGALDPKQFLKERCFGGFRVEVSQELECQVYFYWGARLLTEGKFNDAVRPLMVSVVTECDALERFLAMADLAYAEAFTSKVN